MGEDFIFLLKWWWGWLVLGGVGWLWTRKIFKSWTDQGYAMGKIVGAGLISLLMWWGGYLKLIPFTTNHIWEVIGVVVIGTGWATKIYKERRNIPWKKIVAEELLFAGLLFSWAWVKGHEASIQGLEKFMDFGMTRSILRTQYFPPADIWFAGEPINYYYFGHLILATATKMSDIELNYTFNFMLATLFALAFTMTFSLTRELLVKLGKGKSIAGALITAMILTLGGNLQTIYAFTQGYSGDYPPPFWEIWSDFSSWKSIKAGWGQYWYPNATRFIPFTIHEFPSYSFVVSDIHGHVLGIPFALLMISLLVLIFGRDKPKLKWSEYAIYGAVGGMAFMTNALDGPIYLGIMGLLTLWFFRKDWKNAMVGLIITLGVMIGVVLPFLKDFKPFVSGIGVNCPPIALQNQKWGPFLFEDADKCQKSEIWMILLLWGFFGYWAIGISKMKEHKELLTIISLYCLVLIIVPEFFYVKDIYPAHFRSNTMFKLGYQVFMMMAVVSGVVMTSMLTRIRKNKLYMALGIIPTVLVMIYPYFAVKSYFGNLETYTGLYGLSWLEEQLPEDAGLIDWLNNNIEANKQPVVLEANGDSYTNNERVSTFTGLPTVAGWLVHEWLWRGYEKIAARNDEVRLIYTNGGDEESKELLEKYQVKYIVVGNMEYEKYPDLDMGKLLRLAKPVYRDRGILLLER